MTRSLDEDLRAVLEPLDRATPFPGCMYWDEGLFEREKSDIFAASWVVAGREEDVAAPGAWICAPIGDERIIVARDGEGDLHAFHNVCRHRGAPLVNGGAGHAQAFECPYHGWTYDLRGRLASAPGAHAGFDLASHGLVLARVATFQGFVFTSSGDAPEPSTGAPPWLVTARLGDLRRAHRAEYDVAANWKLCAENFQESHHFERVHPLLEALTPSSDARSWIGEGPWLGGMMEIASSETVSTRGERRGRPRVQIGQSERTVYDALFFPALFTSLQPDYLLTYRLDPRTVSLTRIRFEIFVVPSSAPIDDVIELWERINAEDRSICERQQNALRSRLAAPSAYAAVEDGVHAFDRLVARKLLGR